MFEGSWRSSAWSELDRQWDAVVIGGGITGAGVFRLAVQLSLKTLLVEARDFSFGTSSRSSKLVHGGFRYLYNRQYGVTYKSVREREYLLKEAPNLVEPLPFTIPNYREYDFPSWLLHAGAIIYDLMGSKWDHQKLDPDEVLSKFNGLKEKNLIKGFRYKDAVLDDSRLVLRVIQEAIDRGGLALNYTKADRLLRTGDGKVHGVQVSDQSGEIGKTAEVKAQVVINATGPWTDSLRSGLEVPKRMRKLRGSHLIFDHQRFPASEALTLFHPDDGRAMFVIPWEGMTMVGTTDIDHDARLEKQYDEPFCSQDEIAYVLKAVNFLFPELEISGKDIVSTFSGLRPIISGGAASPSKESRAHEVWNEHGLITITGGKLTTFRLMALQTIREALRTAGIEKRAAHGLPMIDSIDIARPDDVEKEIFDYLSGRYGRRTGLLLQNAGQGEFEKINGLPNIWAEIRHAAGSEAVLHLDDLLLRRVRIGLLLPEGGKEWLPQIRAVAQPELGWSDTRWDAEEKAYLQTWQTYYSPWPG